VKFLQKKSPRRFVIRPEAIEEMKKYPWPGNVRELAKVCERFSQGQSGIVDLLMVQKSLSHQAPIQQSLHSSWKDQLRNVGLRSLIATIEKEAVEDSMIRNQGKITACIKELKISSSAFYRILQEHQLHF
jgi:DNA-binding NtrC family response regulator